MAAFEYKALDAKGKQKKGTIEGDNARQVRQRLKEQGMIPVEVMEAKAKAAKSSGGSVGFKRGIKTAELALITRQLSTLVQSGMPLEECLKAVSEQAEKPRIRTMIAAVRSKSRKAILWQIAWGLPACFRRTLPINGCRG